MSDAELFAFYEAQYRETHAASDAMYSRFSFLLTAIIASGAASYTLLRPDQSGWIAAAQNGVGFVAVVLLALGVLFMINAVLPKPYYELGPMLEFERWRKQYGAELKANAVYSDEQIAILLAKSTNDALRDRLVQAEQVNRESANRRLRSYNMALRILAVGVLLIGLQAIISLSTHLFLKSSNAEPSNTTATTTATTPAEPAK